MPKPAAKVADKPAPPTRDELIAEMVHCYRYARYLAMVLMTPEEREADLDDMIADDERRADLAAMIAEEKAADLAAGSQSHDRTP
jgi:hypothetical protein